MQVRQRMPLFPWPWRVFSPMPSQAVLWGWQGGTYPLGQGSAEGTWAGEQAAAAVRGHGFIHTA